MAFEKKFDHKWKSISSAPKDSENQNGCFDCNICLDFANDPVVTLCGHLYCWPCIYKWFHVQSASLPSNEYPQCPVCKAEISHTTVIPLYGRGQSATDFEHESQAASCGMAVPPRPRACGTQALLNAASQPSAQLLPYRNPYQGQQPYPNPYSGPQDITSSSPLFNQVNNPLSNVFQPVVGMFGEMVYARVFGNSQSLYMYPNSYHAVGSASPRLRRQQMQADKSLSRISLFLLCCFFLCLILF